MTDGFVVLVFVFSICNNKTAPFLRNPVLVIRSLNEMYQEKLFAVGTHKLYYFDV